MLVKAQKWSQCLTLGEEGNALKCVCSVEILYYYFLTIDNNVHDQDSRGLQFQLFFPHVISFNIGFLMIHILFSLKEQDFFFVYNNHAGLR